MPGLTVTARQAMLNADNTLWPPDQISLHSADPGTGTTPAANTELAGGSPAYARGAVTWAAAGAAGVGAAATPGVKAAATVPTLNVPAQGQVAYIGYWRGTTYLGSRANLDDAGNPATITYPAQGTYTPKSVTESAS